MKALMHAHTAYMVCQFNIDNIRMLQELGYEVDVACCWGDDDSALSPEAMKANRELLESMGCRIIETASLRKIKAIGELKKAYNTLKNAADENRYEIVHTQSPIGGVICRLAMRKARKKYGTKVIYAAHGFHFFEGAPKKNWLIYYNAEKFCAKYTDLLITINKEDYKNASERFTNTRVTYVSGAGVDTQKFSPSEGARERVRAELGLDEERIALLSIGELIPRKNHETVIRALAKMQDKDKLHYYIAGRGIYEQQLRDLINELHMEEYVTLLGFRRDISDLCAACDVYVFPSHQEGLPVALMEAMSIGMPCVISEIRGSTDLIENNKGGYMCKSTDVEGFASNISKMMSQPREIWASMGQINRETMKKFDKTTVNKQMMEIYEEITGACR